MPIHFAMNHPLAICQFDFSLKIVIKSKYGTLSKELGYKPIDCVGVQTNSQMFKCGNFSFIYALLSLLCTATCSDVIPLYNSHAVIIWLANYINDKTKIFTF